MARRLPSLTPQTAPESVCGDCGLTRPMAMPDTLTTTIARVRCRCGNSVSPARDGVPYSVWITLADNEDAEGRVPRDPGWSPRS